jgi:methylenetetrahydrofolate dehydrogenase (NADP+)/methenyltetrahydrofolate cyclohydrolase
MPLISGQLIAKRVEEKVQKHVEELSTRGIIPVLAVVLVGDDRPSLSYIHRKEQAAKRVGIQFALHQFPEQTTTEELRAAIKSIQSAGNITGIIVQLPLPAHISASTAINAIEPRYDVDCMTDTNLGKVVTGTATIFPPIAEAVLDVVKDQQIDLSGKNVTIIGTGHLVGRPVSLVLLNTDASVTTCNRTTNDLKEKCLAADIIVSGVGKKHLVTEDMVRPQALVIDTGVSFEGEKMFGDADADAIATKAFVTPTPGGIGPITVAELLANVAKMAHRS